MTLSKQLDEQLQRLANEKAKADAEVRRLRADERNMRIREIYKRKVIMATVALSFGTSIKGIRSASKKAHVSAARRACSYILRHRMKDSLTVIAATLKKDHTAVMEQIQRMEDHLFMKDAVAKKLQKIEQELLTKQII